MTFGVSGKLWRDSLVMYDRTTNSLWSQLLGRAIAGPLEGQALETLPSEVTRWRDWRRRHPDSLVLIKPRLRGSAYAGYHRDPARVGVSGDPSPDDRLPPKSLVYGMMLGDLYVAVPFDVLEQRPVLHATVDDRRIVVFSPPGETAAMAFEGTADGRPLTFERVKSEERLSVRDRETGSIWVWETGACVQGPLEGASLPRVPGVPAYWGIWSRFHPSTRIVPAP